MPNRAMSGLLNEGRRLTPDFRADFGVFAITEFFQRSLVNQGLQPGLQARFNFLQHEVALNASGMAHSTSVILAIPNRK